MAPAFLTAVLGWFFGKKVALGLSFGLLRAHASSEPLLGPFVPVPLLASANDVAMRWRLRQGWARSEKAAVAPLLGPKAGRKHARGHTEDVRSSKTHSNCAKAGSRFFPKKTGRKKEGSARKD